jgi:eukaryotic-like serine/threonine-protein kinase
VAAQLGRPRRQPDDPVRSVLRFGVPGQVPGEVDRPRAVPPFCAPEIAGPTRATHSYLIAEYIDGPSLAEVIAERGPLTGGALHSVAIGVATAPAPIHDAGVIHRDLKPGNILFALGTPKVIDFGLAQALDTTSGHTSAGQILDTVHYAAPERFGLGHPTPGSDRLPTSSPGVASWCTPRPAGPFPAQDAIATAARIAHHPASRPTAVSRRNAPIPAPQPRPDDPPDRSTIASG